MDSRREGGPRQRAIRRTEPARLCAGQLGNRVTRAGEVVDDRTWAASHHADVRVAVHRDLVTGVGHFTGQPRRAARHRAEHEERGSPAEPGECLQEQRRRRGIRTVVETQRYMPSAAHSHEGRGQSRANGGGQAQQW